jgi:predicted nucleotidyltransferase
MLSEQKLDRIEEVLREKDEIVVAYLYGSFARDEEYGASDIDIGLLIEDGAKFDFDILSTIARKLEKVVGREVDLRTLNDSETRFVYNALREAEPIFSRNEEIRRDFEYRTMRNYLDMKPFYREYDAHVRERVTP